MKSNHRWIRLTQAGNIPLREGRAVEMEGHEIAVFNLGERFLAVENRCPHRGGPLSEGIVSGGAVVCPLHAWKVCLEDGSIAKPASERACIASYSTRVEDGVVWVEYPEVRASDPALAQLVVVSQIGSNALLEKTAAS